MRIATLIAVSLLSIAFPLAAQNPPTANPATSKPEVVTYYATIDTVKYVYATAPPVAHLRPGNILEANSLDCFGNGVGGFQCGNNSFGAG